MKRGTAVATGIAALVVGAAAFAFATGAIPNPFDPPDAPLDVVESGSSKARDLGERFIPPDKPDVPEGALPGEADPFHIPDRLADKPAWTADEVPGWQSPFDIPNDLVKPADAGDAEWRRRKQAREAAYRADSRFPRNPEGDLGKFQFDWMILHTVDSADLLEDFKYFVNSADGSWLVTGDAIGHLMAAAPPLPADAAIDGLIRKANGDFLLCGTHPDIGRACMKLGDDIPAAFAWLASAARTHEFLSSIARTPQRLGSAPPGRARGARGKVDIDGTDRYLQVWVAPSASAVATQVPWLGMGSGVIKDARARVNREVRRVRYEGADRDGGDVVIDLKQMQPAVAGLDTRSYRIVTAFAGPALEQAIGFGEDASSLADQAAEIDTALRACPQGRSGAECRRVNRARMKQLDEGARDQALRWAREHGLPVTED